MFKGKDPRADLFAAASKPPATGLVAEQQLARFYDQPPQVSREGRRSWYVRGCNFVLEYSEIEPGGVIERRGQPDEYVLYLDDPEHGAEIEWNGSTVSVPGASIAFVPAGDSFITFPTGAKPVRLLTTKSDDLVALCPNVTAYDGPRSHIPPSRFGPNRPGVGRFATTRLTSPTSPVVSAASTAARPLWSTRCPR